MAICCNCGNFDRTHEGDESSPDFQPDLYYYWDAPIEEDYDWRDNFPDGKNDDRWYHWCVDNWGTKWEPDMNEIGYEDSEILELTFNTAWSPPEGVVEKMREKYPKLTFQCFYDEPGCEIAGYY